MHHALTGVSAKLVRAKQQLDAIHRILRGFKYGECRIVFEEDVNRGAIFPRVHLPKPPIKLPIAIGEMLYHVRSALDHIVYQLALSNSPTIPKKPAFPIYTDPHNFASMKKSRLAGIPEKAAALIETLQPYEGRENPLLMLDKLHNVDEHRTLNLVTAVASDTEVQWSEGGNPLVSLFIGGEEIRDGAIFCGIGVRREAVTKAQIARVAKMEMQGKAAIFVAFDDPSAESLEECRVDRTLEAILNFVRNNVVPAFEPFFD